MKFNGIQTDRLEEFARRLLGIRQGGIVPTLSPEAALEVALPQTLDMLAVAGAWPYGAAGFYAAVAAEFGCANISNISSNLLMTVSLRVSSGASSTWTLVRGTKVLDGAGPITVLDQSGADYRDTRRTRGNFPTGISAGAILFQLGTSLTNTTTGLNRIGRSRSIGGADTTLPEVVLAPGESITAVCDVANTSIIMEAIGTIRPANQDELATS